MYFYVLVGRDTRSLAQHPMMSPSMRMHSPGGMQTVTSTHQSLPPHMLPHPSQEMLFAPMFQPMLSGDRVVRPGNLLPPYFFPGGGDMTGAARFIYPGFPHMMQHPLQPQVSAQQQQQQVSQQQQVGHPTT